MVSQRKKIKVLLGGVPFGSNNIGDEAILECSVDLLREYCPDVHITAATGDQENTARRLGIETCPLIGFPGHEDEENIVGELQQHDVFIWCGATGLSDYPETPLRLMNIAQRLGKKSILLGVGMNTELNPALYRVQPGKRQRLMSFMNTMLFNSIDTFYWQEKLWEHRVHKKIFTCLNRADLILVRDIETKQLLQNIGVVNKIIVSGDAAITLEPVPLKDLPVDDDIRTFLQSPHRKLGICISSQRPIKDWGGLIDCLDNITKNGSNRLIFIPMDPISDNALMHDLQQAMKYPEKTILLHDIREPKHVMTVVSALDAVISSRLHLLIFASNAAVPMIGISRGSKFKNYLRHYGQNPVCTVDNFNFCAIANDINALLSDKPKILENMSEVHKQLVENLKNSISLVVDTIG